MLLHVCHMLTHHLGSHPGSQSGKKLVSATSQHGSSALSDSDVFLSHAYGLQLRGRFPRLAAFYFLLTVGVLAWNPTLLLWLDIWTISVLLWDRGIKSSSVSCFKTKKSWAFLCPEFIFNVDKDPKHKRDMEDFSDTCSLGHRWVTCIGKQRISNMNLGSKTLTLQEETHPGTAPAFRKIPVALVRQQGHFDSHLPQNGLECTQTCAHACVYKPTQSNSLSILTSCPSALCRFTHGI